MCNLIRNRESKIVHGTNAGASAVLSAVSGQRRQLGSVTGFSDTITVIEARTALTGTLSTTSGDATVTGTGTAFLTELEVGKLVRITDTSEYLTVLSITDNTHFEATANSGSNEASSAAFVICGQTKITAINENFEWNGNGAIKSVSGQSLTIALLTSTSLCNINVFGFTY